MTQDGTLPKRIPRIVITGAPGAGKSTTVNLLAKEFGDRIQRVSEVASMLITELGITPGTKGDDIVLRPYFQHALYQMQRIGEHTAEYIARNVGKTILLLDKGRIDIAAHLEGGIHEYKQLFHTSHEDDYGEYDMAVCLGLPEKNIYEAIRGNNPARRETYEQAQQLEKRVRSAWQGHPHITFIPHASGWEEKILAVRSMIDTFVLNLEKYE